MAENGYPPTTIRQRQTIWLTITAHPDDEAMFFMPSIRNLLLPHMGREDIRRRQQGSRDDGVAIIQLLCLSNGDYRDASDGPIRAEELRKACSIIGVENEKGNPAAVTVLDDHRMKDGPNEVWSPDLVSETVLEHIRTCIAPAAFKDASISETPKHEYITSDPDQEVQPWSYITEKKTAPASNRLKESIQMININLLTFDSGGVSGHPNHVDTFKGIQHLLDDKCHITRDKSGPRARLRLHQERTNFAAHKDTQDDIIELNLSAYSLRTISNPLHKYFLWMFVDIIPQLSIWLVQMLWYLAHFLIGGLLFKRGPRIRPFAGMQTSHNAENIQCRIMDPFLVWRAMAAHHSQFVWYRRLSVMFSRYTFINDLQKLTIDMPAREDEGDNMVSLPSVVTVEESDSSPKFLLSLPQMNSLRDAVLPPGLHHRPWKRVYSLLRDGDSFFAFQKLLEDWSRKQGDASAILLIKTKARDMIGGFADGSIIPMSSNVGNAARSRLFKLNAHEGCGDPRVEVYGKHCTTSSSKRIVFDVTRRIVAFGGGGSDAGWDEGFGLCLEDGFSRGTTARCAAFRNEPLVPEQDGVFQVLDVEVWGFVFGQF